MNNIYIVTTNNRQHFIGMKNSDKNNETILNNVYVINETIRSDRKNNLCKLKYIKNENVIFSNYLFIAEADDEMKEKYLSIIEKESV